MNSRPVRSKVDEPALVERAEKRHASSWPALIRLTDGRDLPCVVKDVSRSGARLAVPGAFPLARTFALRIDARGMLLRVRLAWRRGNHCGVRIEGYARLDTAAHPIGQDASDDGPPYPRGASVSLS